MTTRTSAGFISVADAHAEWERNKEKAEETQQPVIEQAQADRCSPEKALAIAATIKQIREKVSKQLELVAELEHTLAAEVGEKMTLSFYRHEYARLRTKPRCERCHQTLGYTYSDHVVKFDGRYWHQGNCKQMKSVTPTTVTGEKP